MRNILPYIVNSRGMVEIRGMKPRPNHGMYLRILREMGPEKRLQKAFELSEFTRDHMREGLKKSNPDRGDAEIHKLYLARMERARSRAE